MKLLTKKQVREKVGYSAQHIQRMVDARTFPAPLKPNGKTGRSLWVESEVDDWITAKLIERDSK